jgi:hypothetical protein
LGGGSFDHDGPDQRDVDHAGRQRQRRGYLAERWWPGIRRRRQYLSTAHPRLLVEVGKDGRVFLLDRDNLGGRKQGSSGGDAVVGVTGPFNGLWGHLALYGGESGYVYFVGNNGPLRTLKYGVDGSGNPVLSSVGTSAGNFGYTSGSPTVTSDGTTPGSGPYPIL